MSNAESPASLMANAFKELRSKKGLSIRTAAELSGVSRETWRRLEADPVNNLPSLKTLHYILVALKEEEFFSTLKPLLYAARQQQLAEEFDVMPDRTILVTGQMVSDILERAVGEGLNHSQIVLVDYYQKKRADEAHLRTRV